MAAEEPELTPSKREWGEIVAGGSARAATIATPGSATEAAVPAYSTLTMTKGERGVMLMALHTVTLDDLRTYCDALSTWLNHQGK